MVKDVNNAIVSTKEYFGATEYSGTTAGTDIEAIYHEEGRLTKTGTNPYKYEYTLKDHLGNARVSFCDLNGNGSISNDEILQTNSYYPFGLQHSNPYIAQVGTVNKYQYNGIEFADELNLNWFDAKYRDLDPTIGRWMTMDPKPNMNMSLYSSMDNNPLRYSDPLGDTIVVNRKGYITKNTQTDNLVFLQKGKKLQQIGEVGKKIDATTIYKNLLKDNAKTAKGLISPFKFKELVKNKGEWDIKNNMKTIYGLANHTKGSTTTFVFDGKNMESQDLGNHHFGVVGKAYGAFPEKFMLEQAGKAQMASGTSKPEWQKYGTNYRGGKSMIEPYGDDPRDQQWIKSGFEYYKEHKDELLNK